MTKIEWTHRPGTRPEVLNPTTACDKISQGCKFCYAEVMHRRLGAMGQAKYQEPFLGHVRYWPDELARPFKWSKPRTVFLNSMSDIFHKDITIEQIAEIYAMMFLNDKHTFIVLTKRAERASYVLGNSIEFHIAYQKAVARLSKKYLNQEEWYTFDQLMAMWPLHNVWQGVSTENQETFDDRAYYLFKTPASIRVFSMEPLIGPIKMFSKFESNEFNKVWCIAGGESGRNPRPANPDWFLQIMRDCKFAWIPFFLKQLGNWQPVDIHDISQSGTAWGWFDGNGQFNVEKKYSFLPRLGSIPNDQRVNMVKVKNKSNNKLYGKQYLEFPA